MKRSSWVPGCVAAASLLALAGLPQSAVFASDTAPPTGTIVINNNRSATNSANVTLALTRDHGSGGSGVSLCGFPHRAQSGICPCHVAKGTSALIQAK